MAGIADLLRRQGLSEDDIRRVLSQAGGPAPLPAVPMGRATLDPGLERSMGTSDIRGRAEGGILSLGRGAAAPPPEDGQILQRMVDTNPSTDTVPRVPMQPMAGPNALERLAQTFQKLNPQAMTQERPGYMKPPGGYLQERIAAMRYADAQEAAGAEQGPYSSPWEQAPSSSPSRGQMMGSSGSAAAGGSATRPSQSVLANLASMNSSQPPLQFEPQGPAAAMEPPAPTPETAMAPADMQAWLDAEKEQQGNIKRLREQRGIAESLGNMWSAGPITAGGVMFNQKSDPFVAEGIREQLADEEDKITSPGEGRLFKSQGLEVEPGMKRSILNRLLPTMAAMENRKVQRDFRERDLKLEEKRMDALGEERKGRRSERKITALRTIADAFDKDPNMRSGRESLVATDKALSALDSATSTGDIASIIQTARAAGEKGPLSNQDVAMYRNRMGIFNTIADRLTQYGAGRLKEDQRGEIKTLLTGFRKVSEAAIMDEARRRAKRYAPMFELEESDFVDDVLVPFASGESSPFGSEMLMSQTGASPSTGSPAGGAGKLVIIQDKAGKQWEMPEDKAQEAQAAGEGRIMGRVK